MNDRILHVGWLSPHVHRVIRGFARYWPVGLDQEFVLPGQEPLECEVDTVVIHAVNDLGKYIDRVKALVGERVPVVGWVWNELYLGTEREEQVGDWLGSCDLTVGPVDGAQQVDVGIRPLVESDVFFTDDSVEKSDQILFARGWQDPANLYWTREVREALKGVDFVQVSGHASPHQMAELYRKHKVIICTRADAGPSYTAIEAVLSGALPALSDTPEIRQHFVEDGEWVGARGCSQDPASIRRAICSILELYQSGAWKQEVERNIKVFSKWTMQAQMSDLCYKIKDVVLASV